MAAHRMSLPRQTGMTMKKYRATMLVAGAAVTAGIGLLPGAASAAPARDGTGHYCTAQVNPLCLSADGVSGDFVLTRTPGNSSQMITVGHFKCLDANGDSTDLVQDPATPGDGPSCPFTNGSGFNTRFEGHEILRFEENGDISLCLGADVDFDDLTQRSCTALGTDWVRAKTSDPYAYVNVRATNTTASIISVWAPGPAGTAAETEDMDTSDNSDLFSRQ